MVVSLFALRQIRGYPGEFTGLKLAIGGMTLSCLMLAGGVGLTFYNYATELREGYLRIGYDLLQPESDPPEGVPVDPPASARALDGKKVFIKGYAYSPNSGGYATGIKEFMLVRDRGDCCFGGEPKITDMIYVRLKKPGQSLTWSMRLQKLHGTLHIRRSKSIDGLGACIYHLDADYLD
jgi:hypothetical protein